MHTQLTTNGNETWCNPVNFSEKIVKYRNIQEEEIQRNKTIGLSKFKEPQILI
jgi:hypothetical protein